MFKLNLALGLANGLAVLAWQRQDSFGGVMEVGCSASVGCRKAPDTA